MGPAGAVPVDSLADDVVAAGDYLSVALVGALVAGGPECAVDGVPEPAEAVLLRGPCGSLRG